MVLQGFWGVVAKRLRDRPFLLRRPSTPALVQSLMFATFMAMRLTMHAIVLLHLALFTAVVAGVAWSLKSVDRSNDLRRNREAKARRLVADAADSFALILRNLLVATLVSMVSPIAAFTDVVSFASVVTALGSEAVLGGVLHAVATAFGITAASGPGAAGGATAAGTSGSRSGGSDGSDGRPYTVRDAGPLDGVVRRGCLLQFPE
jgi:hypothetical protein